MHPYQLNRIDYTGTMEKGKRYFRYQKNNAFTNIATKTT